MNSIKEMRNDEIVQIVTRLNEEKNAVQRVIKKVKQFNASSPHRIGLPTTPRGLDVKVSRFDQSGSLTQRQLYSSANTLSTHDKEWHSKARDITIRDEMPSAWAPSKSLHLRLGLAEESTHRSKPVLQTSSTARTIGSMPLTASRAKLQPSSSTKATTRRFELDFEKEARSRAAKYQFPKLGSDPFFKKKV